MVKATIGFMFALALVAMFGLGTVMAQQNVNVVGLTALYGAGCTGCGVEAAAVPLVTTNFDSHLSATDKTAQSAFETLNGLDIPADRYKGAWVASTSYVAGDIVSHSSAIYITKTANSDSVFTASNWYDLSSDTTIYKGAWTASTSYVVGDVVVHSSNIYIVKTANSDATFTASNWYLLSATGGGGVALSDSLPLATGVASAGTATEASRDDHVHQSSGSGGLTSVSTDSTLSGDGTNSDVLGVANPFTSADETKLDGVETGAQKNPKHIIRFRTLDNNGAIDGTIFFIKADNTEWQSGGASGIAAIEIDSTQFSLAQNPQLPGSTPVNTAWHSLPQDMVDNLGSTLWSFYNMGSGTNVPSTPTFTLMSDQIAKNNNGNYVLQELSVVKNWTHTGSDGVNWQVVGTFAPPIGTKALFGVVNKNNLPDDIVYDEELEGRESDRYASYNNAFVGNSYRSGDWVLSSDTSGPPTTPNLIGQPNIGTGSGVIAFGRLRTDKDPNNLQWAPVLSGSEYASGDVLHITIWDDPAHGHLRATLTSGLTLVGTGDAAYVWATASWVEIGNVADVQDVGDYFKFAEYVPTDLDLRIPSGDVIDPPWLLADGTNATNATRDAIQGDNESVDLDNTFRVDATNVDRYVTLSESGVLNIAVVRMPASAAGSQDDLDMTRLIKDRNWVDIGGYILDVTTNATRSIVGTSLTFTFNYVVVGGTKPTGSTPIEISVYGEDVHRGELARQSLGLETPSIAGMGGAYGQIWTRGASNTDATWINPDPPRTGSVVSISLTTGTGSSLEAGKLKISGQDWLIGSTTEDIHPGDSLMALYSIGNYQTASVLRSYSTSSGWHVHTDAISLTGSVPASGSVVSLMVQPLHPSQVSNASSINIAGKGGTQGQVWTRGSGDENATWSTVVSTDEYVFFADDAAVGGTGNVITVTSSPTADAYRDGMNVVFEPTANNSGTATINVDGLGAKTIVREDGTTLQAGDILNDRFAHIVYDGVFFVLLNRHIPLALSDTTPIADTHGGAAGTSTSASRGDHSHPISYAEFTSLSGEGGSWTVVLTGVGNDDIVEFSGHAQDSTNAKRSLNGWRGKFSSLPTDNVWLYDAPPSGKRIQIKRVNQTVEASTAGGPNNYLLTVTRWED